MTEQPAAEMESAGAEGQPQMDMQQFGRFFIGSLYRILKVASIYNVDHAQTREAIEEFMPEFKKSAQQLPEGMISVTVRGELCSVNGETLKLQRREQERLNELQSIFASATIRGLIFDQAMSTENLMQFLQQLNTVADNQSPHEDMEHVMVPHIQINHGSPDQTIMEAVAKVNKGMYIAHIYTRALVKVKKMHDQVRKDDDPDVPTGVIRRILQSVSELLADEDFMILGLLPMRLVPPDVSSHSVNSAIYAMLLADRLGLAKQTVAYVGMAAIYQDIDRLVGISVGKRDQDQRLDTHRQFSANMRDVATMLKHCGGDVVSTLRILLTYERGCDYDEKVARPFYRRKRHLHLISRIMDIARTYDLLIQGLEGYKARRPDLAIQYVESRAGEVFDPYLVDLLVSTLGLYPVGTTVELTSGEQAVVIRTPDPSADPRRPAVRLLDRDNPTVIDLSDDHYRNIEIARSVEVTDVTSNPSELFLLT